MIIGLMGGVGSGKSTVRRYLQDNYNAYAIDADTVAKEIMQKGSDAFKQIVDEFPEVLSPSGVIDNDKLAKAVFNDSLKLSKLNNITHPATIEKIKQDIKNAKNDIIVLESALLPGSGLEIECESVWFVYCDRETRIRRLYLSRGYSREKSIKVINCQPDDDEYNAVADEMIDNCGKEDKMKEQVDLLMADWPCLD